MEQILQELKEIKALLTRKKPKIECEVCGTFYCVGNAKRHLNSQSHRIATGEIVRSNHTFGEKSIVCEICGGHYRKYFLNSHVKTKRHIKAKAIKEIMEKAEQENQKHFIYF